MLDIINKKQKTFCDSNLNKKYKVIKHKNYAGLDRQWQDSVYCYNSIYNKTLCNSNNVTQYLINNTINAFVPSIMSKKKNTFSSKPEIKHTNNKAIITIYLYSGIKNDLRKLMRCLKLVIRGYIFKKRPILAFRKKSYVKKELNKKRIPYTAKGLNLKLKNGWKIRLIKKLRQKLDLKFRRLEKNYRFTKRYINHKLKKYNSLSMAFKLINLNKKALFTKLPFVTLLNYYNKLFIIKRKKLNILFNLKSKCIVNIIKKIYQKNIEIDLVRHKYKYMNSDILCNYLSYRIPRKKIKPLRLFFRSLIKARTKRETYLDRKLIWDSEITKYKKRHVLRFLRFRFVTGIKLRASGRLTRRRTASKSISVRNEKGFFRSITHSNIIGNNLGSNLQYSILKNKTRNGAFGIRCWIGNN